MANDKDKNEKGSDEAVAETVAENETLRASTDGARAAAEDAEILAEETRDAASDALEDGAAQNAARESGGERSGGFMGVAIPGAIGAVVGGLVALFAGQAMQPEMPAPSAIVQTDALEQRLRALELDFTSELSGVSNRADRALEELRAVDARLTGAIDAAEADRASLSEAQTAVTAALENERTRMLGLADDLGQQLADAEEARMTSLNALRDQVAGIAAAIAATPTPGGDVAEASAPGDAETAGAAASGGASAIEAAALTRLAILEGGLRRIEARVNGLSAEALPTPDLSRIETLAVTTEDLASRLDDAAERIDRLERRSEGVTGGPAAVGVAFGALAQAIAGSSPFEAELRTLEDVAEIAAVPALGDPAARGLASDVTLATRFDAASREAMAAALRARAEDPDSGMGDAIAGRLSGLFTIRRTTEAEGADPSAVLSRAEARIDEGDVHAALAELQALPQAARDAMADWLADAQERADAETALADLRATLLGAGR